MITRLTDANGKTFEVDINNIINITTDLENGNVINNITDNNKSFVNVEPKIVDSNDNEINISELMDKVSKNPSEMPSAIEVTFEATHSGPNRNYVIYHSDSLEKDTYTWKTPYAKPLLKNHDVYSEPLGRVVDAYYSQSEINPERDTINVTFKVTDKDAIAKFLDGRYRTMSIGGSVSHLQCNVCGKEILKDGVFKFCGHWKGEVYNGQKAYWNAKNIEYKEGSIVNEPADDWAQVKKIKILNEAQQQNSGQRNDNDMNTKHAIQDNINGDDILNQIDNLIGDNNENIHDNAANTNGDNKSEQLEQVQDVNDNQDTGSNSEINNEIEMLKEENERLKNELEQAKQEVETLKNELEQKNEEVSALTKDNESLKEEMIKIQDTNVKLALYNKQLIADRLIDFEIASNEIQDENIETRKEELLKMSAKELNDKLNMSITTHREKVRDMAKKVINPALVDNTQTNVIENVEDNDNNISNYTLKDLEEAMINAIFR